MGACCHAEPRDRRHCNLPVLASFNAKQHGVGPVLAFSAAGLPGERAEHTGTSQLTKQERCAEGLGTWLCEHLNKLPLELLNHPHYVCKDKGNVVKRGHTSN